MVSFVHMMVATISFKHHGLRFDKTSASNVITEQSHMTCFLQDQEQFHQHSFPSISPAITTSCQQISTHLSTPF